MIFNERVIIDVDCGTDDAYLLLLLLHAQKLNHIKIEAIVCTAGIASRENVCRNVLRLLELFNQTQIPVFRGALRPFIDLEGAALDSQGMDGFGDLHYDNQPNMNILRNRHGAVAMYDIVKKYPSNVSLACSGPLTTLALAIQIFEDFAQDVHTVYVMGGCFKDMSNHNCTNFNFMFDPAAADTVIAPSLLKNIMMVTWCASLKSGMTLDWRYNVLGTEDVTPFMELMNSAEGSVYGVADLNSRYIPYAAIQAVAVGYADEAILERSQHAVTLELHCPDKRGQIYLDRQRGLYRNVSVVTALDWERLKDILITINKEYFNE